MVQIDIEYEGGLRCRATHAPSRNELATDAPVDNQGKGESFSPTDLVATALGTCMLTTMDLVARKNGWDITGASARVEKSMVADPKRRISKLDTVVRMPAPLDGPARDTLETTARNCPVFLSLGEGVEAPVRFEWPAASDASPRG